ncbi:MAG: YfiR family protein [Hydrogenophaga sp.]
MSLGRRWQPFATGLLSLLSAVFCTPLATAEQATEQAVKAGFIYNFVRFAQWGPVRNNELGPLLICTPGAPPLDGQFAKLQGRTVGARSIEVRVNVIASDWRDCAVLFITDAESTRLDAILRSLGNAPVLTVGDLPGFVKAGGMIGLRMEESRVKFDVNLGSAQRAGLLLNSQMLKLAGQVVK